MPFTCHVCNNIFTRKISIERHWKTKSCKVNFCDLSVLMENLKNTNLNNTNSNTTLTSQTTSIEHQTNNNCNNVVNINIVINPVTKLNTKHINTDKLKVLILKYDDMSKKTPEKLNLLLSGYIKDVICDKNYPENHSVKYTKIRPPTYSCKVEDINGNTISVIKNLKDTCELLTDPILLTLKKKMRQFLNKYEKDDKDDFDYGLYDTAIDQLRKELNNENVRKALSSVLQNDILNNIEMKFKMIENKREI